MAGEILFEIIDDKIALITLNRIASLNSLNGSLVQEFNKVLDECANNKKIRCVILTGAGKGFCAGGDLCRRDKTGADVAATRRSRFLAVGYRQSGRGGNRVAGRPA